MLEIKAYTRSLIAPHTDARITLAFEVLDLPDCDGDLLTIYDGATVDDAVLEAVVERAQHAANIYGSHTTRATRGKHVEVDDGARTSVHRFVASPRHS